MHRNSAVHVILEWLFDYIIKRSNQKEQEMGMPFPNIGLDISCRDENFFAISAVVVTLDISMANLSDNRVPGHPGLFFCSHF